ncbi:MAG: hypothetical protein Q7O66_11225 [Dehalococcoidia bacterium]|nr:hypothetical protein [Dehalococcoidia bacterium]
MIALFGADVKSGAREETGDGATAVRPPSPPVILFLSQAPERLASPIERSVMPT